VLLVLLDLLDQQEAQVELVLLEQVLLDLQVQLDQLELQVLLVLLVALVVQAELALLVPLVPLVLLDQLVELVELAIPVVSDLLVLQVLVVDL
jgi:hypothetical protein